MEIQRSPCFQHALVITYMWLAHSSLDKVYNYSKIIILFSKWQFDRERKCGAIYPYISVTKYFDNTGELVTATPRAFHTHFIGCWNDAILDIIFKQKQYRFSIGYIVKQLMILSSTKLMVRWASFNGQTCLQMWLNVVYLTIDFLKLPSR